MKTLKRIYWALLGIHIPAPKWIFGPILILVWGVRHLYYFLARVFYAEPLFKAVCTRYGKNLRTGPKLHWVQGRGEFVIGDNVSIDGLCNFFFASRYSDRPILSIGNNTGIGHNCSFVVGREIRIGDHCRLGAQILLFDSPGHPLDPEKRKAGAPANPSDVRPIVVENNVWIGTGAVIFPGVSIGENSVVASGAVVMNNVPANVVVAGNPARQISKISPDSPPPPSQ